MNKVDIAIFMPSLRGGGAEKVMLTLATEFSCLGYSVEIVLAQAVGAYVNQVPSHIKIVDLQASRVIKAIFPLTRYIQKKSPSVLFSTQNHANCVAILAKVFSFKTTKVFVRESNTVSVNSGKHKSFIDRHMPYFIRFLYPFSSKVIAVSNGVAADLSQCSKLHETHVETIYNPVVNEHLYKQANETVNHPWLVNKEFPVVLAIGRLTKQKDFSTLICAVEQSMHTKPFRLIILGEGELRKSLETLVENKKLHNFVSLFGFVENPFPYMQQTDVFVLSSLWEGLPNVVIQALSLGGKVVSTDCPSGPREILKDGKYGILVPCNHVLKLAAGIQDSLALVDDNEKVLAKKEYCQHYFGSASIANKYLNLFKRYQRELK